MRLEDVAERVGVSRFTVADVERGKPGISMAAYLGALWVQETAHLGGFFGVLRDALPDHWGRRVIARQGGLCEPSVFRSASTLRSRTWTTIPATMRCLPDPAAGSSAPPTTSPQHPCRPKLDLAMACGLVDRSPIRWADRRAILVAAGRFLLQPAEAEAILTRIFTTVATSWEASLRGTVSPGDCQRLSCAFLYPG